MNKTKLMIASLSFIFSIGGLSHALSQTHPALCGKDKQTSPFDSPASSKSAYRPIILKCPQQNNGTLEIIKRNNEGYTVKNMYKFSGQTVTFMGIDGAPPGGNFKTEIELYVDNPQCKGQREFISTGLKAILPVYEMVCSGTAENRLKFEVLLEKNRSELIYMKR